MAQKLGRVARQKREAAGLSLMDIANRADVSQGTIHYFEQGAGWRRQTDRIVAAYAAELGTTPDALWQAAVDSDD